MSKLDYVQTKIPDSDALARRLAIWRFQKRTIVFTNGCFDILHLGHIDYLARAASLGHVLIVGLNSDSSVRRIKGAGRPICDQKSRSLLLASLRFVDAVVIFEEDTPARLIQSVQPDILVKGGDYRKEDVVGYDTVVFKGGEVIILDLVAGYSTSSIEAKIRNQQ